MSKDNKESPNPDIDKAIKALMKDISGHPPDTAVKILAQAIAWEKAKHAIQEEDEAFDPDAL